MGKQKYTKRIERLFDKSPTVTNASIARITKNKNYAKQVVRRMTAEGKIKRLAKGCYTTSNDPSLSVFCYKPAYLGLQDALSTHNLWEQETIPIIITTRAVRQGIRTTPNGNILIRRINKKYFFGYQHEAQGDTYLPYSDDEKTIIDMIYYNENLPREALLAINQKKLTKYLQKYPEKIRKKVKRTIAAQTTNAKHDLL